MEKSTVKKIGVVLLVFIILLYIFYLLYGANFSVVKTETVNLTTVADSIYADGYIVRNETLITNDTPGVVSYEFEGNRKVAAGGTIAKVYASEQDASNHKQMAHIQQEIEIFEKLNQSARMEAAGLDSVRNQITSQIVEINNNIVNGNILGVSENEDDLLYSLNESMLILGEVTDYTDKIAELQLEYNNLQSSTGEAIAEITSPVSGYFTTSTDGYENKYDYEKANDTDLEQAKSGLEDTADTIADNVIGKVISDLNWYIICPISADESLAINQNLDSSQIKVNMPYAAAQSLPVTISAMNQTTKTDDGALVLECNYMSDVLASLRKEELQIDVQTYEGLYISKSALHESEITTTVTDEDGNESEQTKTVQGVYVINGSVLEFKEVVIAYSGEDFIICKQTPSDDELFSDDTVELYDRVVVGGTDLYDGKRVNV